MKNQLKKLTNFYNKCIDNIVQNKKVKQTILFLTDCPTYKRTVLLSLGYVFLFYLPFTFLTLVYRDVVFFQLDHLYQFSTIVIDFRNRLFDLNFSTWDFKNALGYDYFANFYYIPLDFSLLPYFIFPFLTFSQQMWLSFLLKILVGTFAFSYLLKLYKLNNKTILFASVLYGSSDLFFSQNVFPSYTGLIYYIPLILIAIELMFQKNNFLFFSFAIFQIFLFNSYWSYSLTIFMTISLFLRACFHFLTLKNFYQPIIYLKMLAFFIKSILYYILGLGLAAFFILPIISIMTNEPRITTNSFIFKDALVFDIMVYYKTFFKMLIPNLYMYSGYFYDSSRSYWLPTNHIIIYSSIMASFTLFLFIFTPISKVKKSLNKQQLKTFIMLKIVTITTFILMFIPIVSYLFSFNTAGYLRWYVFFGVLLIINLAFIIEYKLFNRYLFLIFLALSSIYLAFSIRYNETQNVYKSEFFNTDYSVAFTMIIVFIIIFAFVIIFLQKANLSIILLIERITLIGLIFSICVTPYSSLGVKHVDVYGKTVNNLMKDVELNEPYNVMFDSLYFMDYSYYETMEDMAYLYDFEVHSNFNVFHSLINPYFTFYPKNENHRRYYAALDVPYFYYLYMDPTIFIQSNSNTNGVFNQFFPITSELLAHIDIDELDSSISIYQKEQEFSIGSGFTSYYTLKNKNDYNYLWLDSLYVENEELIQKLNDNGFKEENIKTSTVIKPITLDYSTISEYTMEHISNLYFKSVDINTNYEDANVIILNDVNQIPAMFSVDQDGQMYRCYNKFCFVPESGIQKIIVGTEYEHFQFNNSKLFTLNQNKIDEKINKLKKYSTYDVEIAKNMITSKLDNDRPLLMQYKIGYAKGWKAFVDGKEVDIFPSQGGMLSFMLEDVGTHEIVLKYQTPYLKEGILISLVSVSIFSLLIILKRTKR